MQLYRNKSSAWILSLIGFFGIFSTTISKNPVLPLFIKSMDSSDAVIGLIAAISPFAGIIFSFPVGILADKLGKKKLLIVSAFVFVTAPLMYLLVTRAFWLIPIRFFHGIATAILGPVASAIICGAYPETKGEKLGAYSSATLIGRTLAPVVGGGIISYFIFLSGDWNYKMVYAGAFVFSLPVLFMAFMLTEEGGDESLKTVTISDFIEGLKYIAVEKRILATGLIEMASYFTFGAFETYLPLYLNGLKYPAYQIGMIFSVQILSIALTKPLFGKISDNIDRRIQIITGILILGLSIAMIPLLKELVPIIAAGIVFGIGLSFSTVATSTYIADVVQKEKLGSSLGALSSVMDIGHSSGPLITGIIISIFSYTAGFLSCLTICVISSLVFILLSIKNKTAV